jgi:hypothetical protein
MAENPHQITPIKPSAKSRITAPHKGNHEGLIYRVRRRPMSDEEINAFIGSHSWRFAKTMSDIPHAYVVREKCRSEEEFERFVMHIRTFGYREKFGSAYYGYFDWPDPLCSTTIHSYWTMGAPLSETIIINRAIKGLNKR